VQSLQVEPIGRLGGDEFHRQALQRLGNRFRVAKIVFLPSAVSAHEFRGYQPRIVAKGLQLAAQSIEAHNVERIVANIDAHRDDGRFDVLDMAMPRMTIAPSQHHSPVGQQRGRTILSADICDVA
jgi:hypothetical protein